MEAPLVFADAGPATPAWAWVIWIVVGGVVGALAARLSELGRIGTTGYVVCGMLGGIAAGLILGALGASFENVAWSIAAGILGSFVAVLLLNLARGDRGMGGASGG